MTNPQKTVSDIRQAFLSYFEGHNHTIVPSSPLVPQNDPSVMFTMAGMMQFKNIFTGLEKPTYTRAVSSQKCLRAGGKHNDLENVGYTARHHTFFEMLGNFSFGDYFKEEAIFYGWDLVTKTYGLPKDKLLVTIYADDDEAAELWKKVAGLSDDKIIRIATSDNFWAMGDTGPCGPCSEIFYDHGDHIPGGPPGSPDEDGDRFIEIWNLVFMQYEQHANGTRTDLPKPCIDTGSGLERLSALMQGTHDNYETDLMQALIQNSADLTRTDAEKNSHRIIADHLRACSFLIADGVLPSNEGRGYVLRRIMRRGMRHAHLLGAQEPLMYQIVPTLLSLMGDAYPELKNASGLITDTLKNEEIRFKATLDRGLKLLDDEKAKLSSGQALSGEVAFKLYDTYGFPLDLTQDALKADGIDVDLDGFNISMEEQKKAARAAWSGSGDTGTDALWFDLTEKHGSTEFLGYTSLNADAEVQAIVKDGEVTDELSKGQTGLILTNQTPFYGESGGQMGDTGTIKAASSTLKVTDTKKMLGKLHVHVTECLEGSIKTGDTVTLSVDKDKRSATCANHSATHLLHAALRETLGDHVTQKGSLQDTQRTRFDISHPKAVSAEQLEIIENLVNQEIQSNTPVNTNIMSLDDARDSGAMALFGEKYDDEVRVVSMGTDGSAKKFSVELCGGTHVKNTGEIGLFKIISESALSSGVRRVEALTGKRALDYMRAQEKLLSDVKSILKTSDADLTKRLETLLSDRKSLEQQVSELKKQIATGAGSSNSGDDFELIENIKFSGKVLSDFHPKDLKPMADSLKEKLQSGVVALVATNDGKASIVVGVTPDLTDKISAVDLVRAGSEALGGKGGGGRPDMAQAGGPNPDNANDAITAIQNLLKTA